SLLARVGDDQDWQRIADWLDSPDAALKRAAATAWAASGRSLQVLADRAVDPIIEPIVIAAALRTGDDPWTLRSLVQHRPEQPQAAEAWEEALVAMSERVAPSVVYEAALIVEPRGSAPLPDR